MSFMARATFVPAAAEPPKQHFPDLHDPETAQRLIMPLPAVIRMLEVLQVSRQQQATLLNLIERALQGSLPKKLSVDRFTRMNLVDRPLRSPAHPVR